MSAKTTLRERWQEVPEEVQRTSIREMYLATIDDSISENTLNILYEANVIVVTAKQIKEECYSTSRNVISFEDLIQIATETCNKENIYSYNPEELTLLKEQTEVQLEKYEAAPFIKIFYEQRYSKIMQATGALL